MTEDLDSHVRLDEWLWAARFYKTRSTATEAIEGGHVQVNGQRPKPARGLRIGDLVRLTLPQHHIEVVVRGLSDRRGPAPVAQTLYEETPESHARRDAERELRHLNPEAGNDRSGRPTKRDRRQLGRLREG